MALNFMYSIFGDAIASSRVSVDDPWELCDAFTLILRQHPNHQLHPPSARLQPMSLGSAIIPAMNAVANMMQ